MKIRKPPPPESRLEISGAPPPISPIANKPVKAAPYPANGMERVTIDFLDPFSPSRAEFHSNYGTESHQNPVARHLFYNQQLYDSLYIAIDRAVELGMPRIDLGFPLTFAFVSKDSLNFIFRTAMSLNRIPAEGSHDWLCIQCYIRWATACNHLAEPAELPKSQTSVLPEQERMAEFRGRALQIVAVSSELFFLGAAVRELEISLINRRDALRGKGTVAAARKGGMARGGAFSVNTQEILDEMKERIERGQSITNAAANVSRGGKGTPGGNRQLWTRHSKR